MKFKETFGIFESSGHYSLELINNNTTLIIKTSAEKSWVEIRGFPRYETAHNPSDQLHQILDTLDPASVSTLFAGQKVMLNPNNRRSEVSIKTVKRILEMNR